MKVDLPVYKCDTPGCRSTCQLDPADADDATSALEVRGWRVVTGPADAAPIASKHHCPVHRENAE